MTDDRMLREALEPFARAAESLDDDHKDRSEIWESGAAMEISAGDLRRAREVVSSPPKPTRSLLDVADYLVDQQDEPWPNGTESERLHYWRNKAIEGADRIRASARLNQENRHDR
jgi:hypothetical protein